MATQKFYAWGSENDTAEDILAATVECFIDCCEYAQETEEETLDEIDEWFKETCELTTEPQEKDYIIHEIQISIVPKKVIHKTGVIQIDTAIKKIGKTELL